METELHLAHKWKIKHYNIQGDLMQSKTFKCDGFKWHFYTESREGYMSVFLVVSDPDNSLEVGWKVNVKYYLVVYDEGGKEICRSPKTTCDDLCEENYYCYFRNMFPLSKLRGEYENNGLTIKVYMDVVGRKSAKVDMRDFYGFKVLASQADAVSQIFLDHPDIINVEDFRPKNEVEKTAYMYVLLGLIETLNKLPERLSDNHLSNAHSKLSELTEAGFKLDWLVTKLEDAKKTKSQAHNLLEDRIKDLQLACSDLKDELEKMEAVADKKI